MWLVPNPVPKLCDTAIPGPPPLQETSEDLLVPNAYCAWLGHLTRGAPQGLSWISHQRKQAATFAVCFLPAPQGGALPEKKAGAPANLRTPTPTGDPGGCGLRGFSCESNAHLMSSVGFHDFSFPWGLKQSPLTGRNKEESCPEGLTHPALALSRASRRLPSVSGGGPTQTPKHPN